MLIQILQGIVLPLAIIISWGAFMYWLLGLLAKLDSRHSKDLD